MKANCYLKLKRFLDVIISFIAILVFLPFFIIVPIAIKFDSKGPVIFKQTRLGKDSKEFTIYKFRSMYVHNPGENEFNKDIITHVGKFIRKTSIDELPQLINVIKGDMSLIGPRPHPFKLTRYPKKYLCRFSVRPGITGLAQVSGRKKLSFYKVLKYDMEYVSTLSFRNDLKIFFKTFTVLTKNNW